MPISPNDFLSIAKELCTSDEEIKIRTSISRSYYSAYHNAVDYLGSNPADFIGGDGGVHKKLISYFELSSKRELVGIGYALRAFKEKRVIADYKLLKNLTKEDSESSIIDAERIIKMIAEIKT